MENQKRINRILNELYYSFQSNAAYTGKERLYQVAKQKDNSITRKQVNDWLSSELPYNLHRPVRLNFKTRPIIVHGIDEHWQLDLVDLKKLSRFNSGFKYLLVCIDVFSKYVWVEALKTKSATELKKAIENIFNEYNRSPRVIQTDRGSEFLNSQVKSLLKSKNIKLFSTNSERKASVVERVNRTLKGIMFKYFTKQNTKKYIDILSSLVWKYNNSYHRSIKMKPVDVNKNNEPLVWINLYEGKRSKAKVNKALKIGQKVRISIEKLPFQKRYDQIWTEEIFIVTHVLNTQPKVYKLKDQADEPLKGTFYFEELQKVCEPQAYRIEKVIRRKKNQDGTVSCLVRWSGYPDKFNSYVLEEDLMKI